MNKAIFVGHMKHLRAIRAVMGTEEVSVPVELRAGLVRLAHLKGLGAALASPFLPAPFDLRPYVERNLLRRRIRFPRLFGNHIAAALYRTVLRMRARFSVALLLAEFERHPEARALVYNGFLMPDSLTGAVADHLGRGKLVVEKGFFPKTLQCDRKGINFGSTLPRDPGFYRSLPASVDTCLPDDIGRRPTKLRGKRVSDLPASYVFVPMQVPSDMQVLEHSPWIGDMTHLYGVIARLADRMPELNFVVKEHPSFPLSIREHVPPHPRIVFANRNDTRELIEAADAVITINSTAGLESLLLGKRVVTLGNAPYNVEGLVRMASGEDELLRVMTELPGWQPDEALRKAFLRYVYNVFLLPGDINDPKPSLIEAMRRRAEGSDAHAAFIAALPDRER